MLDGWRGHYTSPKCRCHPHVERIATQKGESPPLARNSRQEARKQGFHPHEQLNKRRVAAANRSRDYESTSLGSWAFKSLRLQNITENLSLSTEQRPPICSLSHGCSSVLECSEKGGWEDGAGS